MEPNPNTALVRVEDTVEKVGLNIHISSTPKHLKITQTMVEDFLIDPVMGATILLGERLDAFQRARLKLCWWVPRVMDSSGFSSAKTKNLWICSNLRALLIPDHWVGIIYQTFAVGQQTYWNYYSEAMIRSPIFRTQIGKMDSEVSHGEAKATHKGASVWMCHFKNESRISMPAPGHLQGAKNQAGLRYNDINFDEWTKVEATGATSIDEQLIQRATRHCFNQNHPLWCNHQIFLATAEDTMHPAYDRYLTFKKEVDSGNPDYALLSYSFKDYSDLNYDKTRTFKEVFRENKVLHDMKLNHSVSYYMQEGLGIWSRNGKGWYTQEVIDRCYQSGIEHVIEPLTGFIDDKYYNTPQQTKVFYFLGADPARAEQKKADDGALVVLRAEPTVAEPSNRLQDWKLDFVWAYKIRRADAQQWSAIIHRKHLNFGFSLIEMDSQGGGNWIRPELGKPKQLIRGVETKVRPIGCIEDEATMSITSDFILSMFKIVDNRIASMWGEMNMRHPDKLIDASHQAFLEALTNGYIGLPAKFRSRPHEEVEKWSEERKHANLMLDLMMSQLTKICVQTNPDGTTFFSNNNARKFSSKGRKDFAYAGMYAFVGFLAWLKNFDNSGFEVKEEDAALGSTGGTSMPGMPSMPQHHEGWGY